MTTYQVSPAASTIRRFHLSASSPVDVRERGTNHSLSYILPALRIMPIRHCLPSTSELPFASDFPHYANCTGHNIPHDLVGRVDAVAGGRAARSAGLRSGTRGCHLCCIWTCTLAPPTYHCSPADLPSADAAADSTYFTVAMLNRWTTLRRGAGMTAGGRRVSLAVTDGPC